MKWTVTFSDWNDGRFKRFWFWSNAIKYAYLFYDESLFIDVEKGEKCLRIKDNPDKVKPPARKIMIG